MCLQRSTLTHLHPRSAQRGCVAQTPGALSLTSHSKDPPLKKTMDAPAAALPPPEYSEELREADQSVSVGIPRDAVPAGKHIN